MTVLGPKPIAHWGLRGNALFVFGNTTEFLALLTAQTWLLDFFFHLLKKRDLFSFFYYILNKNVYSFSEIWKIVFRDKLPQQDGQKDHMKFAVKSLCGLPDNWGVLSKHNRTEITKSSSEVFQGFLWSPSTEESKVSVSNSTFGSCLLSLVPHFFSFLIFPSFFLSNNNVKHAAELFLTVRLFMCSLSLWFCLNAPILLLLSISMWIGWFFQSTPVQ